MGPAAELPATVGTWDVIWPDVWCCACIDPHRDEAVARCQECGAARPPLNAERGPAAVLHGVRTRDDLRRVVTRLGLGELAAEMAITHDPAGALGAAWDQCRSDTRLLELLSARAPDLWRLARERTCGRPDCATHCRWCADTIRAHVPCPHLARDYGED